MLTTVLGTLAICFTIARTWPQFVRIVVRKDKQGVSLGTWSLALTNHTGWLAYGILTNVPIFILSNLLAGFGCVATVWILHSWQRMLQIIVAITVASISIYAIGDSVLLTAISGLTLSVVLPQLVKVFRSPATGVSTLTWIISAMSSITWISWAITIERLTVVIAHFILLPAAIVIAIRASRAHSHIELIENTDELTATTSP